MTSAGRSLLFIVSGGALITACGGAAPDAQAPKSVEAEPTTVEEAQAQISRAQAELGGGASADSAPPPPPAAPSPTTTLPPSVSTASPVKPDADAKKKNAPGSSVAAETECSNPCRALASMRRAVTALCRITGDDDERCHDARKTLTSSEARVTPCSC